MCREPISPHPSLANSLGRVQTNLPENHLSDKNVCGLSIDVFGADSSNRNTSATPKSMSVLKGLSHMDWVFCIKKSMTRM